MDPYMPLDDRDLDNPYATPQSAFVPEAAPELSAGIPFSVNDVFNWSWSIFTERMRTCLSIFWGVCGLTVAVNLVLTAVQDSLTAGVRDENLYKLLYILSMFAGFVVQAWLGIGLTLAMIKIARGQPVSFTDVFSGGRFLLTALLAWVVHKVAIAVPIAVAVGVIVGGILLLENQSGVAAFLLFLVVSGMAGLVFIFLAARLSMYFYLVIDRDAGVFESLQESWRLCRNQVGTIILVYCVEFAVFLAGLLAFCVGLVFAGPLICLLETVTYLALIGGATSGEKKPPFSWEEEGP
jgi:hypothetical protein